MLLAALAVMGIGFLRRWTRLDPLETFAYGSVLGMVAGTTVMVPLAGFRGLEGWVIGGVAAASGIAGLALLADRSPASREPGARIGPGVALVLGLFVVRWAMVCASALNLDAQGLMAGHRHIWGDWPHHLIDVTNFAWGDNFPPTHPRFAGHPLNYHYLASLTVAAMVRLGLSPLTAMPLHSFVLLALTTLAIFAFARRVTGDASIAAMALVVFVLGGGFGWTVTLKHALASPHPLAAFWAKPWDIGAQWDAHFPWLDVAFAYLVPQRAVLYGIPLALLALTLLWHGVRDRRWGDFVVAGLAAGLMPLANLGAMLSLALITPFLFLLFPRRGFVAFFAVWAALAVPVFLSQQGGGGAFHFIRPQVGWIAPPDPWWFFWLKSLGVLVPLLLWALADPRLIPRPGSRFLWAFMPIFAIANLIVFQPWDWDNTKVLLYWDLAASIFVAAALLRMWRTRQVAIRAGTVLVTALLIASGLLSQLDQALGRDRYRLATNNELELARRVRASTAPHALFMVGFQHDHPVPMLAGRRALMSYPGWLWSQGIDATGRELDIRSMYALRPGAESKLAGYRVDYVVIGPWEREHLKPDEAGYAARFPRVIDLPPYAVFDVRRLRGAANARSGATGAN